MQDDSHAEHESERMMDDVEAGAARAVGEIEGDAAPCVGTASRYTYQPGGANFPYQWSWMVSGDATIQNYWTTSDGYQCDVLFGKQPVTLTFQQSNPVGVPPVYNVSKRIGPRKC